jgi:hypothetical protein
MSCAKQSIGAFAESLPTPTIVVLERQEHNAMEGEHQRAHW